MNSSDGQPALSIVIAIFNMEREAPRTLYSLSSNYQKGVGEQDYEVIVVDDGSSPPLSAEAIADLGPNFRYHYFDNSSPSPAGAINLGVRHSRGRTVGVMVDGARILSPGVVRYALHAFRVFKDPIVATLGFHLGPDLQNRSVLQGYNQQVEDQLLDSIRWSENGYGLFEISSLAGSSRNGWFLPIAESNSLFMSREAFDRLGGLDERFGCPGGGLVNLDLYVRCCELPDSELVVLLGEGNFHQIHGGVSTNIPEQSNNLHWKVSEEEYFRIRGKRFASPTKQAQYIGHMPAPALRWLSHSVTRAMEELPDSAPADAAGFER